MSWRPTVWLVATAVVAVDQLAKQWALSTLDRGQSFSLIGDLLSLKLVFNSGAAFSFGGEFTWILTIVAVIVTVGIVYYSRRAQSTGIEWLFGIGLGGAVGNLIDRLLRAPGFGEGHVVDMINYGDQFVGNIADIAIVGAAATAVLLGLLGKPLLMPVAAPEKHADARSGSAETSPNDVT